MAPSRSTTKSPAAGHVGLLAGEQFIFLLKNIVL